MKGLNKKLSEKTERKIDQLETSSLKYLLSLCLLLASFKALIDLNAYQTTIVSVTLFWIALSIDPSKRIFIYLSAILSSAYLLDEKAFLLGGLLAVFLIGSVRILKRYTSERNFPLLLAGILSHLGDLYTTSLGLKKGLSEQNPFLQHLGNFGDLSSGLILSKMALFLLVIYVYNREFEGLNSLLKILFASGFFLTLSNLDIILSGN